MVDMWVKSQRIVLAFHKRGGGPVQNQPAFHHYFGHVKGFHSTRRLKVLFTSLLVLSKNQVYFILFTFS